MHVYIDKCVDIGLGLAPQHTGQGHGAAFCQCILKTIEQHIRYDQRLTVATFNTRAITLYERLGFKKKDVFYSHETAFMTMIRPYQRTQKEDHS